jgi:8-oxo-dGTP pyrophosphatase MutT (NUDIX family)
MPISDYLRNLRQKIGQAVILTPGVSAIIINDAGQVLLHRAKDDGKWYLIGGAVDPGEEPAHAAVREAFEETGLIVRPIRLIGVHAEPMVRYANGDVVLYFTATFLCQPIGGELKIGDDESLEVRYFSPDALPDLVPAQRTRIEQALSNEQRAYYVWDDQWLKNL